MQYFNRDYHQPNHQHNKNNNMDKMEKVAKAIIMMPMKGTDKLNDLIGRFYDICEENGIAHMTESEDGKSCTGANFDYTIAKTLFTSQISTSLNFMEWGLKNTKLKRMPKTVRKRPFSN